MWVLLGILLTFACAGLWGKEMALVVGAAGALYLGFGGIFLANLLAFNYPYFVFEGEMEKLNLYKQKTISRALQCGVGVLLVMLLIME